MKRTDLTVDRRAWVIVTRDGRTPTWQCVDPDQTLSTTGDVATYQRRDQAVQAMRGLLGDPAWEPDEDPPEPPATVRLEKAVEQLKAAARATVTPTVLETMTPQRRREVAGVFPPLREGESVVAGDVRLADGQLIEARQDHTVTHHDWQDTPNLWRIHRTDDEPDGPVEWRPQMKLQKDDEVIYEGVVYKVLQKHDTQSDWAPNVATTLFQPLA